MRKPRNKNTEKVSRSRLLTASAKLLLDRLVALVNASNYFTCSEDLPTGQIAETINRVVIRLLMPYVFDNDSSISIASIQVLDELLARAAHEGSSVAIVEIAICHREELIALGETTLLGAKFDFVDLVDAYEELLYFRLMRRDDTLGVVTSSSERRKRGVFYTPPALVEELTHESLSFLLRKAISFSDLLSFKIVDPAMGAGFFLRQSTVALKEFCKAQSFRNHSDHLSDQDLLRLISTNCIYGVDADSVAVDLAKVGLAVLCNFQLYECFARFENMRCGNALVGDWNSNASLDFGSSKSESDQRCLEWFPELTSLSLRCFHWKLEFPQVFESGGFDLVLTNPPWEIEKNNSREFFSKFDQEYLSLTKQSASEKQEKLLTDDVSLLKEWNYYRCFYKGLKTYLRKSEVFFHQGGGDSNSYKLFLELGHRLLKHDGVLAQIVPSGIYSDKGAAPLRKLFVNESRWEKLTGYINHAGLFPIHRSFKFCTLIVLKGGKTDFIETSFLRVKPGESKSEAPTVQVSADQLRRLSPEFLAFSESSNTSDFAFVERMSHLNIRLSDPHQVDEDSIAHITFRREFDMTNDSKLFVERDRAIESGFVLDCYGHWISGKWRPAHQFDSSNFGTVVPSSDGKTGIAIDDISEVFLPLYEGRMIGQFDWAKKGWSEGKGRRAIWNDLAITKKQISPQYLIRLTDYLQLQPMRGSKLAYLAVGAATNSRTFISSVIGDWPCANSVPVLDLVVNDSRKMYARSNFIFALAACMNSFVFDFMLRMRLSSNNLNWFILQECTLPPLHELANNESFVRLVELLSLHPALAVSIFGLAHQSQAVSQQKNPFLVLQPSQRARYRAIVEAIVASAYGMKSEELEIVLRLCEVERLPVQFSSQNHALEKSFHRVDSELKPRLRLPSLFFDSFHLLCSNGPDWLLARAFEKDFLFSDDEYNSQFGAAILPDQASPLVSDLSIIQLQNLFDQIRNVKMAHPLIL